MITLDMKTVMSANVVVNFVGMVVMFILWYQNRNKYSGISLWVLDWVLLTGGALLITQQGAIPNWESMVVSNSMIIGGTLILYFGLRRFAGQKDNPLLISAVSVLFALYVAVHTYYTYVHSDLLSRSINSSAGLFLACLLACWLMFKEVSPQIRRISKGTGFAFAVIAVICLIRIIGFNLMPDSSNLFLQSGKFDAAMVLMLVGATAFLVFNLVLMVNNRLFIETEEMENILKRNVIELRAVFQTTSVGFGILTNRVFREVNDASCEMLGYSRDDIIGKDTRMFYPTVDEYNAVGQMYQILPQLGLVTVEMRLLHKDGRIINVIMSISAFDKNNLSQGVVLSLVDITRRKQLEEKSNYLASFPELNPNPVLEMDTEGNLKYQNPATRSIFPGLGTIGMDHPFLADWRMIIKELQDAGWSGTVVREIKVGNEYYEQVISPVTKNEIRIYSRNITSRTLMAARINNLNSILQLTTNINQLIVKIDDETILLQKACDQFVESRQYLLSWIGLKKDGSFDILPSARAGKGADYLSSAKITWDDSPLGQGPTGICIKTGKLYVVRDILHDPNYEPWREQALKMGFVSSVALPLVMQEKIIGVLNIYSANAESFDAKELDLLAELAGDLSLGIEKIRQRQERLRMDEALKASEEKYSTLIEQSIDGILILEKRLVVFANHRMSEMSGFPQDEILGKYFHQLAAPEYQKMLDDEYQRRQAGEEVSGNHELDMLAKDGRKIAVETKVQRIIFQGKPAAMVTIRDITERKQAEMLANTRMVLLEYAVTHTLEELLRKTLDEVGVFVDSPIGFYHFVQSDQKTLSLQAWSTRTENEFCKADGKGKHYPLDQAGVWVDCVRERRAVIHNDYAGLPHRKGLPEGHAVIVRELVVPIFRGGLVVAVLGVGNKSAGYTQKDIDVVSYLADVAWEIAERKQAEEAIRRSEEKYRLIVENTLDIIFTTNANEEYLYVSPSVTDMLGYKPFELIGKPFVSLVHPDDIPLILEEIQRSYNYGYKISRDNEYRLRHASGEWRWVVSRGARVVDANGKFLNFIGVIRDVTERKQAEEALKASEEKYSALVEGNSDGIIILDDRRVVFANKRMTEMTGYYQDEIIGKYFYQLTAPECKVILDKEYQRRQAGKDIFGSIELKIIAKDGKKIEVESRIRRIVYQEKSAAMVILSDITERKKAEEKILASLNEKETLLKEVHHRVKNNMQVISSLLRLQAGRVKDKDSADLLRDSQNRIQSMALVYNKLYLSQDVANINMADYLSELTAGLIRSYASSPNRITVNIVSGGVFLGVDTAIPCGLVVNELVTNSLKYAFPDNKKGQISISLKEDHNHELELIVSDNGIGIPDEFDLVNNSTLGIKLVGNLVQNQLGGKMELVRSNGTAFKIIFHRAKEEK